jgi:hypothetical protein
MFHPLADDYMNLKETELEERIQDLSRKYFQANNPSVKQQIAIFIDIYKTELQTRRMKVWENQQKNNKDLDKLIKVN